MARTDEERTSYRDCGGTQGCTAARRGFLNGFVVVAGIEDMTEGLGEGCATERCRGSFLNVLRGLWVRGAAGCLEPGRSGVVPVGLFLSP